MRRFFSSIAVVALLAAMLLLSAVPAFAEANENSSCFGQYASNTERAEDLGPGFYVHNIATSLGQVVPGGNEHSAQVLNQLRTSGPFGC